MRLFVARNMHSQIIQNSILDLLKIYELTLQNIHLDNQYLFQ